mgnify:FL=1
MGDWTASVGILIVAVLWIQIFMDYRRKLLRLMPTVSTVSTRREEITSTWFISVLSIWTRRR